MVNFVIIDDDFNQVEINKLINFFEKREILFKNISKNEFNIKDYPKSILICSGNFLNNIGGKDSLVKIARKLSSSIQDPVDRLTSIIEEKSMWQKFGL